MSMHATPLRCQKHLFSLPEGHTYLNSAFMGPLPLPVQQAGIQALSARAAPVGLSPKDFFEPAEHARQLYARLVNADPECVAFIPHIAHAAAIVAKNLHPQPGQNVVLLGDMFPSNVYAWRNWREQGVELRTVSAPAVASPAEHASRAARWNEAVEQAIDARTVLVAVEQAHWTDGTLFELERIGKRCRAVGAAWVVDATQTLGVMPFDVQALQPDMLMAHSYKSMLSNYGLGFAVLGERFQHGSPLEESWLMRSGSEDFARLVDYVDGYAPGMRRFDTSLRANPLLIHMLIAALELLLQWEPQRTRDYLYGIAREPLERLRGSGFAVGAQEERSANLFGITLPPGLNPEHCRAELQRRRIHVAVRGSAVRISPHVYNDAQDLHVLVDALLDLAAPPGIH